MQQRTDHDGEARRAFFNNDLFHGVDDQEIATTLSNASFWDASPGEKLIQEGENDPDPSLYLIGRGSVELRHHLPTGEQEALAQFAPGAFFGEMTFFSSAPRAADVIVVEPSLLASLKRDVVDRLLLRSPIVSRNIIRVLIDRIITNKELIVRTLVHQAQLSAVGATVAEIAHDLKNHMQSVLMIAGEIDALDKALPTADQSRILRQVAKSVTGMIEDVLSYAADRPRRPHELVSLTDILSDVEQFGLLPVERRGRISVQRRIDAVAPFQGDALGMERLLLNLIKNAEEAMPEKGTLSLAIFEDGGDIVFRVSDTGSGIPSDRLALLFRPFASFGKTGGTGLGLAMAKKTADAHGGVIEVETTPGAGTSFVVRIPRR